MRLRYNNRTGCFQMIKHKNIPNKNTTKNNAYKNEQKIVKMKI